MSLDTADQGQASIWTGLYVYASKSFGIPLAFLELKIQAQGFTRLYSFREFRLLLARD
ncbi:hypothetical protein C8R43DRAFT_1135555 [Mycena crocata]|nr:hypothetical protein C8R43DRAFT_1135555 [Mycena crocata]